MPESRFCTFVTGFPTRTTFVFRLTLSFMNGDQGWHLFNADDRNTYPNDIATVQVTFENGRQANGDWFYGRFFNVSRSS